MTQQPVAHYGTVVTQTYGVSIATAYVRNTEVHDIICDLEDELVDKAIAKYQRSQHRGGGWDKESYSFTVTNTAIDTNDKTPRYHAFTSGVRARNKLGVVIVTVFGMHQRM